MDPGEEAAINLARESRADLLLMDDREARLVAERFGLRVIGAVGILEEAADAGLLDLKEVFGRIRQTRFFISERVLEEALQRQVRKNPPSPH